MSCRTLRFCGTAIALAIFMIVSAAEAQTPVKVGVLGNVQGTATVTGADNATRALKPGDELFQGDVIRTDDSSNAQILFLDKSALTLTPGSEVKMDNFVYNPGSSNGQLSIEEAKGAFRFIGGALSKQDHVEIKTPVSTIGIRGGIAQTHITPQGDNAEAIFVYGHDMTVKDKSGRQTVLTKFGGGAKVLKGGSGPVRMASREVAQRFRHYSRINSAPGRIHHNGIRMHRHRGKMMQRRGFGKERMERRAEHRNAIHNEQRERREERQNNFRNKIKEFRRKHRSMRQEREGLNQKHE